MMSGTTTRRPTLADDGGSMLFALLGVIMVAGLAVALFTISLNLQRQTRSDRDFQTAITGGDAGVYQALTQISFLPDATTSSLADTSTIGDTTYSWTADRVGATWQVRARAETGGRTRYVEAEVSRSSRFIIGAFADVAFTMRGSNGADSYNSRTGTIDTGNGSVGSNGALTMNGNAFADRIFLYGDNATCDGNGCSSGELTGSDQPFDIDALTADIEAEMDAACVGGYEGYVASTYGDLVGGTTYCFSSMFVDSDVVLQGASLDDPVTIYLSGDFDMSNHTHLNCLACVDETSVPLATALQIYGTGTSFRIGNQSEMAAAVAMPNASCQGSPSNAQADIYGAMICDDLSNQGGWRFHFDESLLDLGNGQWDVTAWREEVGGTTSFPTP